MTDQDSAVAIVTGGNSGIGLAIVKRLVAAGMKVYVTGRRSERWIQALETAPAVGAAKFYEVDMQDHAELRRLTDRVARTEGRIDVLVNNAGLMEVGTTHEMSPEAVASQIQVLLHGPIVLTQAVLAHMVKAGSGHVISITSAAADLPSPRLAVYSAAKSGLSQFTRSIAAEYGARGIRANVVAPGVVDTDLASSHLLSALARSSTLARLASPDEVAGLVTWLLGSEGRYATGSVFTIDGGLSLGATAAVPSPPIAENRVAAPAPLPVDVRLLPRVAKVFSSVLQCEVDDITVDTTPDDIERWDSLGHVRLVGMLEQDFGVRFEVDEVMEMTSVRAVLAVLARKHTA